MNHTSDLYQFRMSLKIKPLIAFLNSGFPSLNITKNVAMTLSGKPYRFDLFHGASASFIYNFIREL